MRCMLCPQPVYTHPILHAVKGVGVVDSLVFNFNIIDSIKISSSFPGLAYIFSTFVRMSSVRDRSSLIYFFYTGSLFINVIQAIAYGDSINGTCIRYPLISLMEFHQKLDIISLSFRISQIWGYHICYNSKVHPLHLLLDHPIYRLIHTHVSMSKAWPVSYFLHNYLVRYFSTADFNIKAPILPISSLVSTSPISTFLSISLSLL